MKTFLFVFSQLSLVTIVYAYAYRAGYRNAQTKALEAVRKFADPVTSLLDELNESIQKATAHEDEHPASNPPKASKRLSAGGSNVQPQNETPNAEHAARR